MKLFNNSSKDKAEVKETACDCPKNVPNCQSADSIRAVFAAIERAALCTKVPGFGVCVDITMDSGVIYHVEFIHGIQNPVKITDTLICGDDFTIALNAITKLVIHTGKITNNTFARSLKRELEKIMNGRSCGYNCQSQYAQSVQNYINCNTDMVNAIGYMGGHEIMTDIVIPVNIQTVDVVESAHVDTSVANALTKADIKSETESVVTGFITSAEQVVTDVNTSTKKVVTGVDAQRENVSGPVTVTTTSVVAGVETSDTTKMVTGVRSKNVTVNGLTGMLPAEGVTDFDTFAEDSGVITGLTGIGTADTKEFVQSNFTVAGGTAAGQMQVVIPAGKFGHNIPPTDITLPIVIAGTPGRTITYNGNTTIHGFAAGAKVLAGVVGTPVLKTIKTPTSLKKRNFLVGVEQTPVTVAGPITVDSVDGKIVESVRTIPIGNVATTPVTVSVVKGITPVEEETQLVKSTTKKNMTELIRPQIGTAVKSVAVVTEKDEFVVDAHIDTQKTRVVKAVDTKTVSIMSPADEEICGCVEGAGNGIVTVDKTNGDTAVYNTCDINSVKVDE